MKKVSVIVLFYNGADYYDSCLKSLNTALNGDEEVLLIDNNSKDRTPELIRRDYPEFRLIQLKKNLGFSGGMNYGIRRATGEIIVLLNQDIIVDPDLLTEIIKPFKKPETGIVGCKIYFPGTEILQHAGGIIFANGLTIHIGYREKDTGQFDEQKKVDYVTGAAFAARRELIDKLGYFDNDFFPGYYEETDWCFRTRGLGLNVIYQPTAVIYHHEATTLKFHSQRYYRTLHRNRLRFVFKNFGLKFILFKSLKFEIQWLIKNCPPSNYASLIYAYGTIPFYLIKLFFKKLRRKLIGR